MKVLYHGVAICTRFENRLTTTHATFIILLQNGAIKRWCLPTIQKCNNKMVYGMFGVYHKVYINRNFYYVVNRFENFLLLFSLIY